MGVIPSLVPLIHPPEVGSSDLPASDKTPVNLPRVMMMMCVRCTGKDTRFDDTKELIQRDDTIKQDILSYWGQPGNS